jgi:hypothetical protein
MAYNRRQLLGTAFSKASAFFSSIVTRSTRPNAAPPLLRRFGRALAPPPRRLRHGHDGLSRPRSRELPRVVPVLRPGRVQPTQELSRASGSVTTWAPACRTAGRARDQRLDPTQRAWARESGRSAGTRRDGAPRHRPDEAAPRLGRSLRRGPSPSTATSSASAGHGPMREGTRRLAKRPLDSGQCAASCRGWSSRSASSGSCATTRHLGVGSTRRSRQGLDGQVISPPANLDRPGSMVVCRERRSGLLRFYGRKAA